MSERSLTYGRMVDAQRQLIAAMVAVPNSVSPNNTVHIEKALQFGMPVESDLKTYQRYGITFLETCDGHTLYRVSMPQNGISRKLKKDVQQALDRAAGLVTEFYGKFN